MDQPPATTPDVGAGVAQAEPARPRAVDLSPADRLETELLAGQLERMRGMLFAYSDLFFRRILAWAVVAIALLVLGSTSIAPAAVALVPFVVPFAFLETGYLFWYTVFARRHAERLERAIDGRLGRDVLVAHRLEAAYFYPPDAPKVAFLSLARPLGFPSVATVGYTVGAAGLWVAGVVGLDDYVRRLPAPGMMAWAVPAALVWTAAIALYLVWTFLSRHDESRLVRALDDAYGREGA